MNVATHCECPAPIQKTFDSVIAESRETPECVSPTPVPLSDECDYFISTTNAAEALLHLTQFITLCKMNVNKEYTLRLKLRPASCSELFKESIYTALNEMACYNLKDLKARWTILVH